MIKTYDYIIVLKKKSNNKVDGISQLMLLLAIIAFVGSAYAKPNSSMLPLIMSTFIVGWWIFCNLQKRRNISPSYRLALLFAAVGWYFQKDGIWISLIYLIAAVLEKQVKFPQEIAFDELEIVQNSFPKKTNNWREVNNVVLKDGLLTIDFKNNQLIQKEVDAEVTEQVEREFNEFAKQQIEKSNTSIEN